MKLPKNNMIAFVKAFSVAFIVSMSFCNITAMFVLMLTDDVSVRWDLIISACVSMSTIIGIIAFCTDDDW